MNRVVVNSEQDAGITKLYYETQKLLYSYAMCALRNDALAEEAVQDVFRISCVRPEALLNSENPKGWLITALKYVIKNIRRGQAQLNNLMVELLSMGVMSMEAITPDLDFDLICAECVGDADYKLLKMITLDRYTMLEAAKELGITVEACKKRVQRTKKKLKKFLEENR